jgi:hypothetical protein
VEESVAPRTALFKAADFDGSGRLDKGEWLQVPLLPACCKSQIPECSCFAWNLNIC